MVLILSFQTKFTLIFYRGIFFLQLLFVLFFFTLNFIDYNFCIFFHLFFWAKKLSAYGGVPARIKHRDYIKGYLSLGPRKKKKGRWYC